jgi:hypothetical protein
MTRSPLPACDMSACTASDPIMLITTDVSAAATTPSFFVAIGPRVVLTPLTAPEPFRRIAVTASH